MVIINANLDSRYIEEPCIFKTYCKCKNKVCKVIVSNGVFSNFVSIEMVKKLNFPRIMHERPYRAHGINVADQAEVTEQAQVHFSIGKYEDILWCDIIPIVDCHLIFGRAW